MTLTRAELVASAMVSGAAEGFAAGRLSLARALARIEDIVAMTSHRQQVLDNAAAAYVRAGDDYDTEADRLVVEVLVKAGADRDRAREIWLARFPSGVPGVHRI